MDFIPRTADGKERKEGAATVEVGKQKKEFASLRRPPSPPTPATATSLRVESLISRGSSYLTTVLRSHSPQVSVTISADDSSILVHTVAGVKLFSRPT